jgi:hypothetical protein
MSNRTKFILRVARALRKDVMAEDRYQPKPSIRDVIEWAVDGVEEHMQG